MPKDRDAERGDVDGPLERSLVLGMVAAETRGARCRPEGVRQPSVDWS